MDALLDAAFEGPATPATALRPGAQLGRYELVEVIAQGGMGQVWRARDPGLERDVALKVVLPERVNERALEFFTREARAGGRLSHPNVVATYAFGEDEGVTWIAQELVPGGRTVRDLLADARRVDAEPRAFYRRAAELVVQVADGLSAIHAAEIIHRDLKPANVLLSDEDTPKITDFGLARLEDEAALSITGEIAGTWAYMSPEQVMAKRIGIDHRTDVFSLGVMMYELLTQRRPFDGDTTAQLAQQIVYEDPPPVLQGRSQCPRDLAVICEHAMQKRRQDRFESAAALAEDLRRHLDGSPILTRPPGPVRRAQHWIRRNPAKSTGAAVSAAAILVVGWFAFENARLAVEERAQAAIARANERAARDALAKSEELLLQRDQALESARLHAEELEQVSQFQEHQLRNVDAALMGRQLREDILARLEDEAAAAALRGVDFTGVALGSLSSSFFAPVLAAVDAEFADQPALQARLLQATATTMMEAGLHESADEPQLRSLALRTELFGARHRDTLASTVSLGDLRRLQGDLRAAEATYTRAAATARDVLGPRDEETLRAVTELAACVLARGRWAAAEELCREALRGYEELLGRAAQKTMIAARLLGQACLRQGKLETAEAIASENLALARARVPRDAMHEANYIEAYGQVLVEAGRYGEALALRRQTYGTFLEELGADHQRTLAALMNIATCLRASGEPSEAVSLMEEGLATARSTLGPDHPFTRSFLEGVGSSLRDLRRLDEAEPHLREALAIARRTLEPTDHGLQTAISALGVLLKQKGDLQAAETLYREVLGLRRATLGEDHPATLVSLGNLGGLLRAKGSPDAEEFTRAAYEGMKRVRGAEHPYTLVYAGNLAFFLLRAERFPEALVALEGHVAHCRAAYGDDNDQTAGAVILTSRAHRGVGDAAAARATIERFLETAELADASEAARRLRAELSKLGR